MERFRTCFYRPLLSSSENFDRWTQERQQGRGRARRRHLAARQLEEYEQPPIDEAIRAELEAFVVRRRTRARRLDLTRDDGARSRPLALDAPPSGLASRRLRRSRSPRSALRDDAGLVIVDPLLDGEDDPVLRGARVERRRARVAHPDHDPLPRAQRRADLASVCAGSTTSRSTATRAARSGSRTRRGSARSAAARRSRAASACSRSASRGAWRCRSSSPRTGRSPSATRSSRPAGGALRVWNASGQHVAADWCEGRFLPTLRPLAELEVDRVLVTHGQPVLQGGARALAKALDAPPWSRRERPGPVELLLSGADPSQSAAAAP